jgi:predicted Zn-dependent protease
MLKNGMDAYTGYTAMTMNNQSYVVRLIAIQHSAFSIQHSANNGYHSLMLTPQSKYQNLSDSLQHASYSLDKITDQEATAIKRRKIKIIRARSGDTVNGLSSQMAFYTFKEERFIALNNLTDNQGIKTGQLLKLIV